MIATKLLKPLLKVSSVVVAAAGLCLSASAVQAFTFASSGDWGTPLGTNSTDETTIGGENRVYWGQAATSAGMSGLGYQGNDSAAAFGEVFTLGRLRHFNNPVLSAASSVDLTINIDLGFAGDRLSQSFAFNLLIDETSNIAGTCQYPGVTICPDKISWENNFSDSSFRYNGQDYTLQLFSFGADEAYDPNQLPVDFFISEEQNISEAFLYARIVEVPGAEPVPEPGAIMGLLLAGLAIAHRHRRS